MPTRILMADLSDFVKDTLLNIRTGLEEARAQGLVVELPLHVDFQVEVVTGAQSLVTVTTNAKNTNMHQTVDKSGEIENSIESYGGNEVTTETAGNEITTEVPSGDEVTTEDPVTDTEQVDRDSAQSTTEGGSDLEISNYNYVGKETE